MSQNTGGVTGQGNMTFRVLHDRSKLPPEAQAVLKAAHGGFAVDRRADKGEVYFALPGAGIIQLSRDLSNARMLPTNDAMRNTNMHNASIWADGEGTPYLAFPGNDIGKVFTTTLGGELVTTLDPPGKEMKFGPAAVNEYFAKDLKFIPTDVVFLHGRYFITTGYSALDYVLTATVDTKDGVVVTWNDLAFGGKGTGPGQFGTGHGITITPERDTLAIADRPNSEIDYFTPGGEYKKTLDLPKGSLPCDVDFEAGYAAVGCLEGPDKTKGAPIYILKDGEIVSTLMPKDDLGLADFTHVHNAVLVQREGKFYVIAQAWNPGDFVVLEQVK